ncbi:hypothetical protein BRETT_003495 [Brettanomyces bruxellensis]|uniref:tRNA-binding domain-containing protein n=1 Tax=Dekkera bruxellensis TaxID=5007 RepID=A0A871R6I3_DEKBR|nr:uncharacterized protein BRETT_003495 [Brettanomyces bruxellensis]QOU19348.1 hypothetical protein BRETT_003495 [Brettanomyces bruxellensis]
MSSIADILKKIEPSSVKGLVTDKDLSNEELALKSQWETLAQSDDKADFAKSLNDSLRSTTYAVGNKPTSADVEAFKSIFIEASKCVESGKVDTLAQHRHIVRWIDLLQNTLLKEAVPESSRLAVKFDVELPREVKEKKKKGKKGAEKETGKGKKESQGEKKNFKPDEATIAKQRAAKQAKKAKKAKAKKQQQQQQQQKEPAVPSMIDFRVGFIQKAIKHPNADSLYVSTIDMGDKEGPRTVCSGLVKFIPLEELQQRLVVVVANLKPVKMRGIKSSAMVLCASDPADSKVEFINPPAGSKPGDKIFFEGYNGTPVHVITPKKNIWETCQPKFTTTPDFSVIYKEEGKPDARLVNEKGELCKCTTIASAVVR